MVAARTSFENITAVSGLNAFAVENWVGEPRTFTNNNNTKRAGGPELLKFWRENPVGCGKDYECTCTERFTKPCDVVRHLKNQHFGGIVYQCNHCNLRSTNTSNLNGAHQKQHQADPEMYVCSWPGCTQKPVKSSSQFFRHIPEHGKEFAARERERVTKKVAVPPRAKRAPPKTKSASGLKRGREDSTLQGETEASESRVVKRARKSANSTAGSLRAPAGAHQGVAVAEEPVPALLSGGETSEEEAGIVTPPFYMSGHGTDPGWYRPAGQSGVIDPQLLEMEGTSAIEPRMMMSASQGTVQEAREEMPSAAIFGSGEEPGLFGSMLQTPVESTREDRSVLQELSSSQYNQPVEPSVEQSMEKSVELDFMQDNEFDVDQAIAASLANLVPPAGYEENENSSYSSNYFKKEDEDN